MELRLPTLRKTCIMICYSYFSRKLKNNNFQMESFDLVEISADIHFIFFLIIWYLTNSESSENSIFMIKYIAFHLKKASWYHFWWNQKYKYSRNHRSDFISIPSQKYPKDFFLWDSWYISSFSKLILNSNIVRVEKMKNLGRSTRVSYKIWFLSKIPKEWGWYTS